MHNISEHHVVMDEYIAVGKVKSLKYIPSEDACKAMMPGKVFEYLANIVKKLQELITDGRSKTLK